MWRRPLGLILAIGLGIAGGLASNFEGGWFQLQRDSQTAAPEIPVAAVRETEVDPEVLARVQSMRDEARALTAAEVALDERAHERWMPRIAKIEAALEDAATPETIRMELLATIAALECVGVLDHAEPASCVTLDW